MTRFLDGRHAGPRWASGPDGQSRAGPPDRTGRASFPAPAATDGALLRLIGTKGPFIAGFQTGRPVKGEAFAGRAVCRRSKQPARSRRERVGADRIQTI